MSYFQVSFTLPKPISEMDTDERLNVLASFALHYLNLPARIREGKIEMTVQSANFTNLHARLDRKPQIFPMQ